MLTPFFLSIPLADLCCCGGLREVMRAPVIQVFKGFQASKAGHLTYKHKSNFVVDSNMSDRYY